MRLTSEVNDTAFPFADDAVPFILVFAEGGGKEGRGFEHASTREKKLDLLEQAQRESQAGVEVALLAPWPGVHRTDVFMVDNYDEALAAFA